ncbi:hypothetical protein RHS03_06368, partial [Rhizoctonia solani]
MAGWWDIASFGDMEHAYMEISGVRAIYQESSSGWRGGRVKESIMWVDTAKGFSYAMQKPVADYKTAWETLVASFALKHHNQLALFRQFPTTRRRPVWWTTIKSWEAFVAHGQHSENIQPEAQPVVQGDFGVHQSQEQAQERREASETSLNEVVLESSDQNANQSAESANPESAFNAGVDLDADTEADEHAEPTQARDANADPDVDPNANAGADANANVNVNANSNANANTDVDASAHPDADPDPDAAIDPDLDMGTSIDLNLDSGTPCTQKLRMIRPWGSDARESVPYQS